LDDVGAGPQGRLVHGLLHGEVDERLRHVRVFGVGQELRSRFLDLGEAAAGLVEAVGGGPDDRALAGDLVEVRVKALEVGAAQRLDTNLDTLDEIRADVGARTNRLAIASSRLGGLQTNATQLLSDTEDADMAQTITQYTTQQAAYNAALRAGANIVQTSLLDFLN